MLSIETAATGSFSEHLACKRRSSGANYVRRREAAKQPLADATLPNSYPWSPRSQSHKKLTNF